MKATLCERVVIQAVRSGEWEIDSDGRIWRTKTHRGDRWCPGTYRVMPCARRRVERKDKKTGYLILRLQVDGKRYMCGAHRLVYQHFKGDIPDGLVINHDNGQKDDNRPDNLLVDTYSGNTKHAYRMGLIDEHGEKNPAAKLTDHQVAEIRLAYASGGVTMLKLADKYGVSFQHVSSLVKGTRRPREPGPRDEADHRHNVCEKDPVTGRFLPRRSEAA